jgi:hypothetical protein
MQGVPDVLHEHRLEKEADSLEKFHASVKPQGIPVPTGEGVREPWLVSGVGPRIATFSPLLDED